MRELSDEERRINGVEGGVKYLPGKDAHISKRLDVILDKRSNVGST